MIMITTNMCPRVSTPPLVSVMMMLMWRRLEDTLTMAGSVSVMERDKTSATETSSNMIQTTLQIIFTAR